MSDPESIPYYSSRSIRSYEEFIEKHYPQVKLEEVHRYAGITSAQVIDGSHWFTQREVNRFYEKVVELTGNHNIAREAGFYAASSKTLGPIRSFIGGTLGPTLLYTAFAQVVKYYTRGMVVATRGLGPNHIEITFTPVAGSRPQLFQCENTIGHIEASATILDCNLTIEHPECFFKGGETCRYVLHWTEQASDLMYKIRNAALAVFAAGVPVAGYFFGVHGLLAELFAGAVVSGTLSVFAGRTQVSELLERLHRIRQDSDQALEAAQGQYDNAALINEVGNALSRRVQQFVSATNSEVFLTDNLSLDEKIDSTLKDALQVFQNRLRFERAVFFVADEVTGAFRFRAGFGLDLGQEVMARGLVIRVDSTDANDPLARCVREKANVLSEDHPATTDADPTGLGLVQYMACPLVHENTIFGALVVGNTDQRSRILARDIHLLTGIAPVVAMAIENLRLAQQAREASKLEVERAALKKDLEVTRAIQNLLIPKSTHIRSGGFRLDAYYEPSAQSGGDWWWYDELPGGRRRVLIGDVTGHGAGSAMVTAMVAGGYQAARLALRRDLELPELLPLLNKVLCNICSDEYWVAFMAVEFDLEKNLIRYVGGGIPPLLLHRPDAGILSLPLAHGGALGTEEFAADPCEYPFEANDRVLLCTDGAYEFSTHDGRAFGRKKLVKTFSAASTPSGTDIDRLVSVLKSARADPAHFQDDVTILLASRPV